MVRLESQLAPLSLWPAPPSPLVVSPPAEETAMATEDLLAAVAPAPLAWLAGVDLVDREAGWAQAAGALSGSWFEATRRELAARWGFVPPSLHVVQDASLPTNAWRLEAAGELLAGGDAYPGLDLVLAPGGATPPELPYAWTADPLGGGHVTWMPIGPAAAPPAGCERLHWLAAVARHVGWGAERHIAHLLTADTLGLMLAEVNQDDRFAALARHVSSGQLLRVFRTLIAQGVAVRPLERQLEALQQAVLVELAARTLTPADVERIERQLPLFATPWLVGIIRRDLGLPGTPPDPPAERLP